jgi:peptidoglycan/xylan/chitin deacetylase (PgdA/CDA1 family)
MRPVTRVWRRLDQARQWLKRRLAPPGIILMYHRVTELANDPYLLAVTPEHFREHLAAIQAHGNPWRLQELVQSLKQGKTPKRAVVVTFDDGYADNLHQAKPLLERYQVPGTFFLTAGQLGQTREFWWDELDRLLLQPGDLPPVLQLPFNGTVREWRLEGASRYTEEEYQRDRTWHVERPDTLGPRQRVFRALFDLLYGMPSAQRLAILDNLRSWAAALPIARPSHRTLTSEEAIRLGQGNLVEIGAHSMTHPVLAALSSGDQWQEIHQSKASLDTMLGHEVLSFAYPHGSSTPEMITRVGEAGFLCACSSDPNAVYRQADPLHLPRLCVRDWDGAAFARWLRWWIG